MTANIRTLVFFAVLLLLVGALMGYNRYTVRSAQDVAKIDTLSGQRIGTIIGWESDLLLSDRDDVTLMRYDTLSECILALSYHQIDAIGMDMGTFSASMRTVSGLEAVGEPLSTMGSTLLASLDAEDSGILDELNQFAHDFQCSEDYQDYLERLFFENGETEYVMREIPVVKNGKPLNVCYYPEYYPACYMNTVTGEPEGASVEFVERFAYAYGYTINFTAESETGVFVGLGNGTYDLAVSSTTDAYRDAVEASGYALMSEPYSYCDVRMIHVKDGQKVTLSGFIEE